MVWLDSKSIRHYCFCVMTIVFHNLRHNPLIQLFCPLLKSAERCSRRRLRSCPAEVYWAVLWLRWRHEREIQQDFWDPLQLDQQIPGNQSTWFPTALQLLNVFNMLLTQMKLCGFHYADFSPQKACTPNIGGKCWFTPSSGWGRSCLHWLVFLQMGTSTIQHKIGICVAWHKTQLATTKQVFQIKHSSCPTALHSQECNSWRDQAPAGDERSPREDFGPLLHHHDPGQRAASGRRDERRFPERLCWAGRTWRESAGYNIAPS